MKSQVLFDAADAAFNRTIVELKCPRLYADIACLGLLIVP